MNVRDFGDCCLLVELEDAEEAQRLRVVLARKRIDGVLDLVPAQDTLLIVTEPGSVDLETLKHSLQRFSDDAAPELSGKLHTIPVHYDGADLEEVARRSGMHLDEVMQRHCAPTYKVAFLGFSPGFPYLTGLDPALRMPRLATPRTNVPPGSVAIADAYTGIYTCPTPGGWRILGHTDVLLFDATAASPASLAPGDQVRFRVMT